MSDNARAKVLLVGKLSHENFGDLLMAIYYARWLLELCITPVFYKVPAEVRERLRADVSCEFLDDVASDSDIQAAIFFGGGYFGHSFTNFWSWPRKWLDEGYFLSASAALVRMKIPYIVSSVEVGPLFGRKLRSAVGSILDGAEFVVTRNQASYATALRVSPGATVIDGRDVVYEEILTESGRSVGVTPADVKTHVGIHVTDKLVRRRGPLAHWNRALLKWIESIPTCVQSVRLIFDSAASAGMAAAADAIEAALRRRGVAVEQHRYVGTDATLAALRSCTHFVTTKLHSGVIVHAFGGQVLAFNDQPKVKRFYESVGEPHRVLPFIFTSAERMRRELNALISSERLRIRGESFVPDQTNEIRVKAWLQRVTMQHA